MDLGIWEIVIIVGIIVLFFGAKKIPELAKGIGEGMTEFKNATKHKVEEGQNQEPVKTQTQEPEKTTEKVDAEEADVKKAKTQ